MRERPIMMSAPMVRAILDGRKSQTRRVVKPQPPEQPAANCHPKHTPRRPEPYLDAYCSERKTPANPRGMSDRWCWWQVDDRQCLPTFRCPYGAPGDRLWVRETHAIYSAHGQHRKDGTRWGPWAGMPTTTSPDATQIAYYREGFDRCDPGRWRSPIHMPRWASRITLQVTGVRVERLQDLSQADAIAEGVNVHPDHHDKPRNSIYSPVQAYRDLWESLHGPGSWDANPWVWVVEFHPMSMGLLRAFTGFESQRLPA